jgi:tetratricopeptide (TPR) repeat protein
MISILILLSLIAFGGYCMHRSRRSNPELRIAAFGVFWFFIALAVESSVIALGDVIFEHRLYLPSVGVFSAASVGAFMLFDRLRDGKARLSICAVLVLLPLLLASATYVRNHVWSDRLSLWTDVVRKSPRKGRARANIAGAYKDLGMLGKAVEHYKIALGMEPERAELHNNIGNTYLIGGMTDKGVSHLEHAVSLKPDLMMAHYNLGVAHLSRGQIDKAQVNFKRAVMLNPYFSDAHNNLGVAYSRKGLSAKAIRHFRTAIRLKPENDGARKNLEDEIKRRGSK